MLALFSSCNALEQPPSLDLRSTTNGNLVYGSHKQIYQEVNVVKALSITKFPVYLVNSKMTRLNYAMKVFLHKGGESELYFKNESRFASLRHPNVIRNLFFENEREVLYNDVRTKISYTIMEYAPHGNLFNFVKNHRDEIGDKLIRTYFRQLIEGLEFIHKSGVSHMDLKLDNLLLDQDFTLKIADFDMAHFRDDAIILSHGTKYFRAPEVRSGTCTNTKAADIFSAGITLFAMKTQGVLPQFEDEIIGGVNFGDLLKNDVAKFWINHARAQKHTHVYFDQEFKDLFISMTRHEIAERATISTIKASKWYNGPVFTAEELKSKMQRIFEVKN